MLMQFRFENFKSFKDDTILDLSATKITEGRERVRESANEKILPMAAIYGANASGKSNVLEAFRFMRNYVARSFAFGGDSEGSRDRQPMRTPFLFNTESRKAVSSFEVFFTEETGKARLINYGFTLDDDGIQEEWLNIKAKSSKEPRKIFYRKQQEFVEWALTDKEKENVRLALEKEALIVSLGAKLRIDALKSVRQWFLNIRFADFGNPAENLFLAAKMPKQLLDSQEGQKDLIRYLSAFDTSIIGFDVEQVKYDDADHLKIWCIHRTLEDGKVRIPLNQESAGTQKMLSMYPLLRSVLETGGVFVVDELNSRLHPLLERLILLEFLLPEMNPNKAQIIFTTHDSWMMANQMLRRDEIWFTEKDERGITSLYSLADFTDEDGAKIRKDESLEKNYLLGKYGAIPETAYLRIAGGCEYAK